MAAKKTSELTDTQKQALKFIRASKEGLSVGEIAAKCGIANVSAWSTARALENRGLVKASASGSYKAVKAA